MRVIKTILFLTIITITTLTPEPIYSEPGPPDRNPLPTSRAPGPFLSLLQVESTSPRTARLCGQDSRACRRGSGKGTCCNYRCVETGSDARNCGACGKKCAFGQVCCKGECVNTYRDSRHCGSCNNMCKIHGMCVYGICDYAI
ncbi:Stigma-specific STIG1-like protein 1 [Striga hermonthica]|uniref:Stigma-specific STIG1-like protein 1 n=1 Tax=Striga hermonthica TaxID=68872 RepID=A0A9N7MPZ1_STRHE|nr:Stigma-specific STIG1-like protein 1 [Striga hermonthica]